MIELARCDDFELGPLRVRPSSRELVSGSVASMIEPKVMQLLVALARQRGQVVARDDIIAQCWGTRVVGEDAINRVIGKLRRVAEGVAGGAFQIETVARVGLRLTVGPPTIPALPAAAAAQPARTAPRRWLIAVVAVGTVASGLAIQHFTGASNQAPAPHQRPAASARGLPAAVSDLETRGLSAMFENTPEQTAEGVTYLRQATTLAPRSAPVWGSLAMSYVLSLGWVAPSEHAAVVARVRDAAAHALALDPAEPRAAAALVSLEPTFRNWLPASQALQRAESGARPDMGPLRYQRIQFLMATGHTSDALRDVERLARFSPLIPWIQAARINLLASAGRLAEADRAAEDARAIWPREPLTWFTRFDLAAFNGQPDRALAMTADRPNWPKRTSPADILLAERTVHALATRDPGEIDAVLRDYRSNIPRGQGHAERAMRVAAALGRPGTALEFATRLYGERLPAEPRGTLLPRIGAVGEGERPTAALFLPPLDAVWPDPGFRRLLVDIGLTEYWRSAGQPDLCAHPAGAAVCRDGPPPVASAPTLLRRP